MAALLRSQDGFDLETAIREWQSRQNERQHSGPAPEPDEKSAVARLTAALDTLFREIVVILSDREKFPRDIFISLDRSRSCFSLWSDGHGVAIGGLDDRFQRSGKLRHATIKTLSHLSTTLIDGLLPVAHVSTSKTEGLCDQVNNILDEVKFCHVADDSSSDSTSGYSTADIHELAEDLKTDVDCLIELDQIIREPVPDLEPETKDTDASQHSWEVVPHQPFVESIEKRFPKAGTELFSLLGMVNYDRFLRCQDERERNQLLGEQTEQAVEITGGSKFHDSGLGSSLNPASSYAETIMSYKDGNRSVKIPPLPEQAKGGKSFPCVACGRLVTMTTNSQWKRHLYHDLQPYVCLDTSCQRSDSTFSSRANWIQHLALDHSMEPGWEQIRCPLCADEVGPGKIAVTTHLAQHLEEISLLALPKAPDSETNSEISDSDRDDIRKESQDSEDKPQDLETVPIESEGELQEQQPTLSHQTVDAPIYSLFRPPTEREGKAASPLSIQDYEPQMFNNDKSLTPSEASVETWKRWEDLVHATTKEAAGDAHGDEPPIFSDYPASSSFRPTSGDAVLLQHLQHGQLERPVRTDTVMQQEKRNSTRHSSVAEVNARKRDKPLPPIVVDDPNDPVAMKRARKVLAARKSRERKGQQLEDFEAKIARLEAERDYWRRKSLQIGNDSHDPEAQIHNGKEAAFHRRMGEINPFPEEAEKEVVKARAEAEEATYGRLQAEQKSEDFPLHLFDPPRQSVRAKMRATREGLEAERKDEEERARKHTDATGAAEEKLGPRFEGELKAAEAHRHAEAEARAEAPTQAEREAREKLAKASEPVSELRNGGSETEENHETRDKGQRRQPMRAPALTWDSKQADRDLMMHTQWISEQQRRAAIDQNEIEVRKRAEEEARLEYEARLEMAGVRDQFRVAQETGEELRVRMGLAPRQLKVQEGMLRQEKEADRAAGVEPGQHLDDWQTQPYRWICPSCGSKDQDRRKGPVCSNCSYLLGDGDGFETILPEPLRTTHLQRMAEEQLRQQHLVQPERQAAFASLEGAPPTEHQDSSRHAEQSLPDSSTKNHKNALNDGANDGANDIPHELSFMEPSVGIDSHTAALKNKLNPIRLSTVANRPLSDLDLNDSQALPRIQLGNTTDIHNTIPSLNEDTGLVEGLSDHDRDWSLITDEAEQRRRADRMAQRAYRLKLKKRLEDLERRAGAADGQGSDEAGTSQERPLNGIPIYPTQGELGRARDRS
ncbi:hypothetical protein NCS52_00987100 [Fusarium sp. LHS14.1]|nr:hypothetical protein NCS52_00987100 [Fusarium sp. LHS14.1]